MSLSTHRSVQLFSAQIRSPRQSASALQTSGSKQTAVSTSQTWAPAQGMPGQPGVHAPATHARPARSRPHPDRSDLQHIDPRTHVLQGNPYPPNIHPGIHHRRRPARQNNRWQQCRHLLFAQSRQSITTLLTGQPAACARGDIAAVTNLTGSAVAPSSLHPTTQSPSIQIRPLSQSALSRHTSGALQRPSLPQTRLAYNRCHPGRRRCRLEHRKSEHPNNPHRRRIERLLT